MHEWKLKKWFYMEKEDKKIGTDIMDKREIVNVFWGKWSLLSCFPGPPSPFHFLLALFIFLFLDHMNSNM